ncbi:MAG: glycosyltransferase family 2 protein [Candidatus Amulumruptor caecigallinarius]|nr:glycosyltransferase family 2 protein [Candidatus Amulumruptor caecigallinarius]MCM1396729.1 glycosyltransferase family 2 protein [Candidatus Amulumruptor caecigallinarius]MCM1453213.1 glycosyltransferase family 2 protein [bacterium]
MKPVAVIILNWNGAKLLRSYLPSVIANTPAGIADIIVADNGSTDDSLRLLAEEFPQVQVISFPTNLGYAEGYNEAIRRTGRCYTVLLNSDVEVKDDWLTPLYRYMETHPATAAVQPKVLSLNEPFRFEYAGASGGFLDRDGYPYCRGRVMGHVETDFGQYDDARLVDWATGACLMVRTERYLAAGGLDPLFFAHMEEIDLCWRLRLAGDDIAVVPESRVWHLGGGSLPADSPRKTYLNFRNSLLMLHKNLPNKVRRKALLRRRLLDTLAWGMFVVTLKWRNASAIIGAHRDYRRMVREHYADIPSPSANLLKQSTGPRISLLAQYYLRRHRTFSAITAGKSSF